MAACWLYAQCGRARFGYRSLGDRHMNSKTIIAVGLAALAMCVGSTVSADAKTITLPTAAPPLTPSPLPGYAKAETNCVACHSAEYMLYQPPTAPRATGRRWSRA